MLDLFVYGSLKRGQQNFKQYCSGFADVQAATVAGRLYRQANGYPMLAVPDGRVLAVGTADVLADVRLLKQMQHDRPVAEASLPAGDWQWIEGDLFRYDGELKTRVRQLDRLEDFCPGRASLYHRAIVAIRTDQGDRLAWAYVAPDGQLPAGATQMPPRWP